MGHCINIARAFFITDKISLNSLNSRAWCPLYLDACVCVKMLHCTAIWWSILWTMRPRPSPPPPSSTSTSSSDDDLPSGHSHWPTASGRWLLGSGVWAREFEAAHNTWPALFRDLCLCVSQRTLLLISRVSASSDRNKLQLVRSSRFALFKVEGSTKQQLGAVRTRKRRWRRRRCIEAKLTIRLRRKSYDLCAVFFLFWFSSLVGAAAAATEMLPFPRTLG